MIATMKNIVKRYGNQIILDHFNLEIMKGEILGLLGPNGAGKTTAIRSLSGLIDPDGGEIKLLGQKQSTNNLKVRYDLGLVTQEMTVFNDLSVMDNLKYFGGLYGLKGIELRENIKEVLEFIGLQDHTRKKPKQLSGGMQRRLNIGCALVHKPKFVIMDEPTVGIDPQSRNHILESVKKLAANGTTVLYTSHYMEEIQSICDRIIIMDTGRVIAEGTVDELVGKIKHEDCVKFTTLQGSQALVQELKAIAGVKHVELNNNDYTVISIAGSGNVHRIMEMAQRYGGITSFSEVQPTLEDVFLTLTGKSLRDGEGA